MGVCILLELVWVRCKNGKFVSVQATNAEQSKRYSLKATRRPLYHRPRTTAQLNKTTVGPQSQFGRYAGDNKLLSLPGFEPLTAQSLA